MSPVVLDSLSIYLISKTTKYVILRIPVPIILVQKDFELKLNTLVQNSVKITAEQQMKNIICYMQLILPFFFSSKTEEEKKRVNVYKSLPKV